MKHEICIKYMPNNVYKYNKFMEDASHKPHQQLTKTKAKVRILHHVEESYRRTGLVLLLVKNVKDRVSRPLQQQGSHWDRP